MPTEMSGINAFALCVLDVEPELLEQLGFKVAPLPDPASTQAACACEAKAVTSMSPVRANVHARRVWARGNVLLILPTKQWVTRLKRFSGGPIGGHRSLE